MKQRVIGIIGTIGAGKDTAGDYLASKLGVPCYQISAPLKSLLVSEGIEPTRERLVALGTRLAKEKGDGYLAEYLVTNGPGTMIITGMRQIGQLQYLKGHTDLLLVSIDATPAIRFKRIQSSPVHGEATTLEEFMRREIQENSPPNAQRLFECMEQADIHLVNEGMRESLFAELDVVLERFK